MYDVIIVGAGPAGISASLYAKRGNLNVLVLYRGESQLEKAHMIDNYYGFPGGISGKDLYEAGIEQAKRLGVDVKEEEVTNIEMIDLGKYKVKTEENEYETGAIIIATGNKKVKPNIKGIEEFDGKGISYCAICDGFFYRGKNVVLIGNGKFVLSEAKDLENIVSSLTILTNGLEMEEETAYKVDKRKIKEIKGDEKVTQIEFEDGDTIDIDGIFVAQGIAGGSDFAKKMGILTNGDDIAVNEKMETNVKGIYSCGNLTGGLLQVNKAVYEGAVAGLEVIKYIKESKE